MSERRGFWDNNRRFGCPNSRIMGEAVRCSTTQRPLTHSLELSKEGLAMDATQTPEDWRPIPGYEGHYEASSLGRIRSLKHATPYVLKPQWTDVTASYGRYQLTFSMSGRRRTHCLHLLIAEVFHGPRPDGMWACHNNSDPRDNRPENLRWDTPASNHVDMLEAGNHHYGKRTHCKRGHEYTPENTYWHEPLSGDRYVSPNPYRRCKKCDVINRRISSEVRSKARREARRKSKQ